MPKLPSPYRVPEQHLLSPDSLRYEAETRAFHRSVNDHNYMSWYAIARKVKPDLTYEIKTYGYQHETLSGHELLERIRSVVNNRCCTFVDSVTRVPADHATPVDKLWITFTDDDGNTRVNNYAEDAWDHSNLTTTSPSDVALATVTFGDQVIDQLVEVVLERRLPPHEPTPDFNDVRNVTRQAIINGLALMKDAGQSPENTVSITGQRAGEAFDRCFHLSRIRAAGITLDDHPEYRSYQKFYELGMAPPTHAQMADTIIAALGQP